MGRSGAASFKEDRASLLPQSGEVIDSLLPDDIDGGLERWVKTITIEGLEEAVAPNEILEPGAHLRESHVNARCVQFTVELFEHLAADTSTSVIASHCTTTHLAWRSWTTWRIWVRNAEQFAKNSGASHR